MGYQDKFYSSHKSLTFDDVLIQPSEISYVESRLEVDLSTNLTTNVRLQVPIIASPMDRVTNLQVACEMARFGGAACFHRFQTIEAQLNEVIAFSSFCPEAPIIAAISAQLDDEIEIKRIETLSKFVDCFIIDTAMGTNVKVLRSIEFIRNKFHNIDVIAGNVVTPEGCLTLLKAGAQGIRSGIGNGSGCLTRIQTGVGRGQLSTLIECADICKEYGVSLISDGGHHKPGDIAKAIAAGADVVMMGSPLAGHDESPGEILYLYKGHFFKSEDLIFIEGVGQRRASEIEGLLQYKQYRGMASREAQEDWKGLKQGTTFEGVQKHLKTKGPLEETLKNFIGGLRSSLTYVNARNIKEFHKNAKFEKLSPGALKESYER